MGTIIYEPVKQFTMNTVVAEVVEKEPGWIEKLSEAIGAQVEEAIGNAIQEHIVIPVKVFLIDSWQTFMVISKWGCVIGFIIGGCVYMMGDEVKGKKIALGSIIIQIVIQLLNLIFLG